MLHLVVKEFTYHLDFNFIVDASTKRFILTLVAKQVTIWDKVVLILCVLLYFGQFCELDLSSMFHGNETTFVHKRTN